MTRFFGSGTSLIAPEMTGLCDGLKAPLYVDVIVRRWQVFIGRGNASSLRSVVRRARRQPGSR
jgi:hypothetical protein